MSALHIYLTLLLPTLTVMAEPVIVQRVVATADIIISPSHTVSVYMSTPSKKVIEQKSIGSLVTLSVKNLNGSQQAYLALPIINNLPPYNCTYSMGKSNSSNEIHYCLDGYTNVNVVHINNRMYHPVPTDTALNIRTVYSRKPIPNDTYLLPIEIISYIN